MKNAADDSTTQRNIRGEQTKLVFWFTSEDVETLMSGLLRDGIEQFIADTPKRGRALKSVRRGYPQFQSRAQPAESVVRERRWTGNPAADLSKLLAVGERLAALRLKPAHPAKDVICYVEDWAVEVSRGDRPARSLGHGRCDAGAFIREAWKGDFFLLAGGYHTVYQRYRGRRHPIARSVIPGVPNRASFHHPISMFWLGFRHKPRLHSRASPDPEVVTPGETVRMPGGPTGSMSGGPSFSMPLPRWIFRWSLGRQRQPGPDPSDRRPRFLFLAGCLWALPVRIQLPGCL